MLTNHELANIISYCSIIFICALIIFIHVVRCDANLFSHGADAPNGGKYLAEILSCLTGLNASKVSEGYIFGVLHFAVRSRELGILGNGTCL